jgi:RHS repeat-associated protein
VPGEIARRGQMQRDILFLARELGIVCDVQVREGLREVTMLIHRRKVMRSSGYGLCRLSGVRVRALAALLIGAMTLPLSPTQADSVGQQVNQALKSTVEVLAGLAKGSGNNSAYKRSQSSDQTSERAERVVYVSLCPRRLLLYVGEQYTLSPLPLDTEREPVHGVSFSWESSNKSVAEVASNGTVTALASGHCLVTARVANKQDKVRVEVREGQRPSLTSEQWDAEHAGDCVNPEESPNETLTDLSVNGGEQITTQGAVTPSVVEDPDDFPNVDAAGSPANATGHPRFLPNLALQASAVSTDNQLGSSNFNLTIPVFSSSGRGVGVGLSLVYNSRLWTKDTSSNTMVFNYDQGWPAPGFRLNYGRIVPNYDSLAGFPGNYLLIESDGTRIPLIETDFASNIYRSQDGQYIEFDNRNNSRKLIYPNGTVVRYFVSNQKLLPQKIEDVNGNSITIDYITSCADTPRIGTESCTCGNPGCDKPPRQAIKHISDTLGRFVRFYYYANGNLAEIRVPGYNGGLDRKLVTFAYQPLALAYNFGSMSVQGVPASNQINVLRRVYFPDTGRGYLFEDYSGYGMYRKASMRLGMTSATDGSEAAYTEYAFNVGGQLSDSPRFTQRKDWWQGKTDDQGNLQGPLSPALTEYAEQTIGTQLTNTVTHPDQTKTVMVSINNTASPLYGVMTMMKVLSVGGATLMQQDFSYSSSPGQGGLQRSVVETTPDNISSNKVRVESIHSTFGRLEEEIEYGFAIGDSFKKRRRTKYVYLDGSSYTDKGLVRLVQEVMVFDAKETNDNGDDTLIARTRYSYDESEFDWGLETYAFTNNCTPPGCPAPPGYDTGTVNRTSRGNVTKVEYWSNAQAFSPDISFRHRYDNFGNEVKAELSCCSLKRLTFSSGIGGLYYSKPMSVIEGPASGPTLTDSFVYDFNTCFLNSQTDAQGRVTSYAPDAAMRVRTITLPKLPSDFSPNPTVETFYPNDPNYGNHEGLIYRQKTTYLDGGTQRVIVTNQWLDGAGRVVRVGTGAGSTPSSFDVVKSIYDQLGRLRKVTNPYTTTDPNGETFGLPNATAYDYDAMGRVKLVTLPGGQTVQNSYNGAETTVTDQVGRQRKSVADGLGRLVSLTEQNPTNGILEWGTTYNYDLLDNLVQINQGGQIRKFKYDSLSRLTFELTPEQDATINDGTGVFWSTQYTYTGFGAIETLKDARGVLTTYGYDGLNRPFTITYNTSGAPAVEPTTNVSINYNNFSSQVTGNGKVSFITDGAGREDYSYDGLSRLASKTRTIDVVNQYTTGYEYNQAGQPMVMVYPSGKRVKMGHDSRGRVNAVEKVNSSGTVLTSYMSGVGYSAASQVTSNTLGNGVVENYQYDAQRLQMTRQQATKGVTTLMDLTYNYQAQAGESGLNTVAGNSGQLMGITGTIGGFDRSQAFSYDNVERLKTATGWGAWQRRYDYDRWSNRTAVWDQASGGNQIQSISLQQSGGAPTNRILNVSGVSYIYDAAGNLTSDNGAAGKYKYDAESRLVKVDGGGTATYSYDSGNRRVKKVAGGHTTYYIWEGSQVIAEYSTAPQASGELRYYLADRLSTRLTTDNNGNVVGRQDHQPFGEDGLSSAGAVEKHRFTSYERDGETNTDYAINRQYSHTIGRFMRPDPVRGSLTDPQTLNRYAYVRNDPLSFVDPEGLFTFPVTPFIRVWAVLNNLLAWVNVPAGGWTIDPSEGGAGISGIRRRSIIRCPPTAKELIDHPAVKQAMNQAWAESNADDQQLRHEEGGFMFWDPKTGAIAVVRAPRGGTHEIDLLHPPEYNDKDGKRWALVGNFHTHPFNPHPSAVDEFHAAQSGYPWIIKHYNKVTPFGPNRRGGRLFRTSSGKFKFGGPYSYPGTFTPKIPGCP